MTLDTLTEIIQSRRSVFPAAFTGEVIPDKIIQQILSNANQAPTHKQTEPWRFHVIEGKKRQELAQFFQKIYEEHTPKDAFSTLKYKKFGKNPLKSSHIIGLGMQRDPQKRLPEWEEIAAVACAIQNIYLSMTAAGYGGYWSTPSLMIHHIGEFLDLHEGERCLGFFYMGVPIEGKTPTIVKGDIEDKVNWYN